MVDIVGIILALGVSALISHHLYFPFLIILGLGMSPTELLNASPSSNGLTRPTTNVDGKLHRTGPASEKLEACSSATPSLRL